MKGESLVRLAQLEGPGVAVLELGQQSTFSESGSQAGKADTLGGRQEPKGVSPLFFKSAHPGHPPESQQRLRPRKGGATDDLGVFLPSSRPYSVCFAKSCAARVLNPSHPHTG